MVGGTRIHRTIHEASLGRDEKSFPFRKEKNEPTAARKLEVSLDRADNVIEGGPRFRIVTVFEVAIQRASIFLTHGKSE